MGGVGGLLVARPPAARRGYACPFPPPRIEETVGRSASIEDVSFMAEALRLAGRIPARPWPNPPVGAVVVRDGRVVGRGAHLGTGTDHAEAVALREAGPLAKGATLYCTLEPCNHQGRRPACAPMVASSGIARLVIGVRDSNPRVAGGGLEAVRRAGVAVESGVLASEALELVWPFVATRAFERPFVLLKTATSRDGFFAPLPAARLPGTAHYLTGADARRDVHRLRRWSDVVAVGEATLRQDRPRLDGRLLGPSEPCPADDAVPACVDTDLSLDEGWPRPFWVFAGRAAASSPRRPEVERRQGTVVPCDEREGHVDPVSLVREFARRGGHCLMLEAGPRLSRAFLDAGVVDRWIAYVAPATLGQGETWPRGTPAWSGHVTRIERVGEDEKTVFDRMSFEAALADMGGAAGEGR